MGLRTELLASIVVPFAMGCVTAPLNGQHIGDFDDNVSFTGYIFGQGDKACIYVNDEPTGTFGYINDDTASSTGTTRWGITGYAFSVSEAIPASSWKCNLPLDGTARSWVKIQESDAGGCLGNYSAAQDDLDYTYDAGSNLSGCLSGNSSWSEFWDDCPVSDDAPVIELNADRTATYPSGCGEYCDDANDCDDSEPCTADSCHENKTHCVNTPVSNGTSCATGGNGYVCEGGECVPPTCDPPGGSGSGTIDNDSQTQDSYCTNQNPSYPYGAQTDAYGTITCYAFPQAFETCFNENTCGLYGDGACGNDPGETDVGPNPGVLCDGGVPIDCTPQ